MYDQYDLVLLVITNSNAYQPVKPPTAKAANEYIQQVMNNFIKKKKKNNILL